MFLLQAKSRWKSSQEPAQIVVHGLPYATTWQDLKDLTKIVTAAAGGEVKQVTGNVPLKFARRTASSFGRARRCNAQMCWRLLLIAAGSARQSHGVLP